MQQILNKKDGEFFDAELQYLDFMKLSNFKILSIIYKLYSKSFKRDEIECTDELDLSSEEKEQFNKLKKIFLATKRA